LRRVIAAALLAVPALALAGCSVGYWLAGAPAPGRAPAAAHAHVQRAPRARTAASLLAHRCAGCHETPDPHAMSASAWLAALDRMKLRMRLASSEWDSLATLSSR
jgi:hypothetical protein